MELTLETKVQPDRTVSMGPAIISPVIDEDYWTYRVRVSEKQAVVGFPKFLTVGIGFMAEDNDWNTNLPYSCNAQEILEHIRRNKGDELISDEDCLAAIRLIQEAAARDR